MAYFSSGVVLYSERVTVILGYLTLASAVATFGTCRTCQSLLNRFGIFKRVAGPDWYRALSRLHGFYWWGLVMGAVLHLMSALMHTGIPGAGDPDGSIHRLVLATGGASLVLAGVVLSSCRSLVNLVSSFREHSLLAGRAFLGFYRYHTFFWAALTMLVVVHFISVYSHIRLWPQ
jgi:hypothetical protein